MLIARLVLCASLTSIAFPALAGYVLREFTVAGATSTALFGINDLGEMVGSATEGDVTYGFVMRGGRMERIFDPALGSMFSPWGISNTGVVAVSVRGSTGTERSHVYEDGKFTFIGESLYLRGISPDGRYLTGRGPDGTFVYDRDTGVFQRVPQLTFIQDMNRHGVAVGQTRTNEWGRWGVRDPLGAVVDLRSGVVTTYDFDTVENLAHQTVVRGINDQGDIAGWAYSPERLFSFHYSADGLLETFWMPDAAVTWAQGLNNDGTIVGYYFDSFGIGPSRAFIGIPIRAVPEPGAVWMWVAGLLAIAALRRQTPIGRVGRSRAV